MATVTHLVGAERGPLPHQPRRHARRVRARARLRRGARRLRRSSHVLRRRAGLAALPRRGRAADGAGHLPRARRSRRRRSLRGHRALALAGAHHDGAAHLLHARPDAGTGTLATFLRGAARADRSSASIRSSSSCTSATWRAPSSLALEKRLRGVFNVAGPQPVPLSMIVRETGARTIPMPEFVFNAAARPLRPAAAPARRARAHQVPGRDRRLRLPRGHGLHLRGGRGAGDARVPRRLPPAGQVALSA